MGEYPPYLLSVSAVRQGNRAAGNHYGKKDCASAAALLFMSTPIVACNAQEDSVLSHHSSKADDFKLHIPRLEVRPGEVVAIVGRVGSGKSSIFTAVLDNMRVSSAEPRCQAQARHGFVSGRAAGCGGSLRHLVEGGSLSKVQSHIVARVLSPTSVGLTHFCWPTRPARPCCRWRAAPCLSVDALRTSHSRLGCRT